MSIPAKPNYCPHCHSSSIIKKGSRQNLHRQLPIYFCKGCYKYFTTSSLSKVKYPPRKIMKAISYYNIGHSQSEVANLLSKKHRCKVPRRTISEWVKKYKTVCTYSRLRDQAIQLYSPNQIIKSQDMEHRQVYTYQIHQAKLELLQSNIPARAFNRLKGYLQSVFSAQFPHHYFQEDPAAPQAQRSSQIKFETLPFVTASKQNQAGDLASLGLMVARTNRERHPAIQEFMLINDSSTIACEVPIYLTQKNLTYFKTQGFQLPLENIQRPITGHIDIVQVRNGLIHILDYKPDAKKIKPENQLITYALALASHTKLPLKLFKCAWFDERDFFEFYPLHAVYPSHR